LFGDDAEEDLDHVQPGATRRREMHGDPRIRSQRGLHVGTLVRGVVVADDVQFHLRVRGGDEAKEVDELLIRMFLVTLVGGQLPGRDVQRGEQGCRPVANVVMGPSGRTSAL